MRISTLQILFLTLLVATGLANDTRAQGVLKKSATLAGSTQSISSLLETMEKAYGVTFVYSPELIHAEQSTGLPTREYTLSEALQHVLGPLRITYEVVGKNIVLNRMRPLAQTQTEVRGRVLDATGTPLAGVSVTEKDTRNGAVTNEDGEFAMTVSEATAILRFSYVGYITQEVPVGTGQLDIVLDEDLASLEEVVVVGFGTQKKTHLTGAVSQITAKELEARPVTNMGQALQGLIPNLNITIPTGNPNYTPGLNVRGGTTFSGGAMVNGSPLVLVDGIEMDINQLNPEDIENVSVLKDAASAAIYGARAAFGVMLVTTKKGTKNNRAQVTYSGSAQWNRPSHVPNQLDAFTIQDAAIKAVEMRNETPSQDMYDKLEAIRLHMENPSQYPSYFMNGEEIVWVGNTRPYEESVRDASPLQKHNINLSGGTEKTSYYASLGYMGQEGLYKINTDKYQRFNALLNLNSRVTDWFDMEYRTSFNTTTYTEPVNPAGKGGWWGAMSQEPYRNINMPIMTPADSPVGEMYTDNILSFMDYGSRNGEREETMILGASPIIRPLKGWKIQADITYKRYSFNRKQSVPELLRIDNRWNAPTNAHTNPTYVQRWKEDSDHYLINAYTDYTFSLKEAHNFYGLAGFSQEWYVYDYLGGRGEGILSPSIPVIQQTLGNEYAYDSESHWAIRSGFYRFNYDYKGKYLFESNGRYDGSSRFPKDRRFKLFPGVSAGWRISEENFFAGIKHVVNDLKFSASYGSLGNQNVSYYIYIPTYGSIAQVQHIFSDFRPLGITPPGLVDADLTWETATTLNFRTDMTLFNRLGVTFDWYHRKTTDILIAGDKLPAVLGAAAPTRNSGIMSTKGFEIEAKWRDALDNGFRYDVAFNVGDAMSEVVSFDGNPNNLLNSLYVGQKAGELWGYETYGLFQSQEEIDGAPSQNKLNSGVWYPGDVRFVDLNGDEEISSGASTLADPGDRRIIGNSTPRFRFGLNMNAAWKNFDVNVFFQGVGKRDYWIGSNLLWGATNGGVGTWEIYDQSWTPERTNAFYPAYGGKSTNVTTQTRYLQNAAYIRMKNLSIGYTLPESLSRKASISRARLYAAGLNLWEYTKVPEVFDPEMMSADYPMLRSLSLGLHVTF
ncbi:TonB-dependent receptor [Parapedobacter sp. DT-150]|uniref:TonB-dependent receptor n=1 Tax=Parapedobacter sp. DT-150 TaxID=3396162 RepID=UPI003F1B4054